MLFNENRSPRCIKDKSIMISPIHYKRIGRGLSNRDIEESSVSERSRSLPERLYLHELSSFSYELLTDGKYFLSVKHLYVIMPIRSRRIRMAVNIKHVSYSTRIKEDGTRLYYTKNGFKRYPLIDGRRSGVIYYDE